MVDNVRERNPNIECDIYEGFLISRIDCIYYDIHHIRYSYFDKKIKHKLNEAEQREVEEKFYIILDNFKSSWQMDKEVVEKMKRDSESNIHKFKHFFKKIVSDEDYEKEFRLNEPTNTKASWQEIENFSSIFEFQLLYKNRNYKDVKSELKYRLLMNQTIELRSTKYDYLDEYMEAVFGYLEILNVKNKFDEIRTNSTMDKSDILRLPIQTMMDVDSWGNRNEVMHIFNRVIDEKRIEESFVEELRQKMRV